MIFPERVFGSSGVKTMLRRFRDRADLHGDVVAQLLEPLDRALLPALQRHERDDRLHR